MQDEHFKALFDTQKSTYENALKVDGPDSPTVLWLIDIWDMHKAIRVLDLCDSLLSGVLGIHCILHDIIYCLTL